MHAFEYEAPVSLADAIEHLSRGNAKPLAGGTDLIDQMRNRRHLPDVVVDVKKIAELNVLHHDAAGLHIGAATPCCRILADSGVQQDYVALVDSCQIIGGIQIQSRASIGGNLCNSGPAADSTPAMIALNGVCVIAGPGGTREVPVEKFCTAPGANVLEQGELLVEVRFPKPPENHGAHYRRFIPRNEMDIAVVGVGASVQLDGDGQTVVDAKVSLGAVAPTALVVEPAAQAVIGKPANDETWTAAGAAAQQVVAPITDMRGTREYRIHLTGVLTRRVLAAAAARARGESIDYRPGH